MAKKRRRHPVDPDVCPHCGGRNTIVLEARPKKDRHECHDCGNEYRAANAPGCPFYTECLNRKHGTRTRRCLYTGDTLPA